MKFKDVEPGRKFVALEVSDHVFVKLFNLSEIARDMGSKFNVISTCDGHGQLIKDEEEVIVVYA